jgi:hypothetical protein
MKSTYFGGINSISFDFIYENIFNDANNKPVVCFPNLKSLYMSRCLLSQPLIEILCSPIHLKFNQLPFSFHEYIYQNISL